MTNFSANFVFVFFRKFDAKSSLFGFIKTPFISRCRGSSQSKTGICPWAAPTPELPHGPAASPQPAPTELRKHPRQLAPSHQKVISVTKACCVGKYWVFLSPWEGENSHGVRCAGEQLHTRHRHAGDPQRRCRQL